MDDRLRGDRTLSRRPAAKRIQAAAAILCALLAAPAARGQISPGELSHAHAKFDGSDGCLNCHAANRGVDRRLCLACHTPIQQRIDAGKGLHARPDHGECEHCHIEHQGRAFELVYWGKAGQRAFDHAAAGYVLQGAHKPLACRACHRQESIADPAPLLAKGIALDQTFLGLETRCASCHQDAHRGQFGDADCASCHGLTKFRPAELFNHDRSKFPLTLAHVKVACARCHPAAPPAAKAASSASAESSASSATPDTPKAGSAPPDIAYRGVPTTCAGCHKDPHQGRFGTNCETCHTGDEWKRIQRANFDHGRTRYPLTGKHMSTDCAACHPPGSPRRIADFERCAACHADAHAGQLARRKSGGECGECHSTAGFRPSTYTVALHEATPFPLLGTHRTTQCTACHRTLPPAELERAGVALVRLAPAPRAAGPAVLTQFRFPQSGCQDCHRDPHAGDTEKYLGKEGCLACHALTDWRTIRFDHSVTKFPVAGLHLKVSCLGCHK
ncbi:MAG: hypothetical protein QG573_2415, partial [Acidobacteriota bacterium]|nr:hypothetical protein [Acidobacteriota bacterium]